MDERWTFVSDYVIGYAYVYYGNQWVSYDDINVVKMKVSLYSHASHTPLTYFVVCTQRNNQVNQEFEKILQRS
jgi:hypothetical protein